jgi:hypothetical protein
MPVWQSAVAVALSFLLALVACRVTGETDTTPVGAMGKVTQLAFGALNPGNVASGVGRGLADGCRAGVLGQWRWHP